MKKNIQENDFKRLIELAYKLDFKEDQTHSIEDVKAAARKLGIPEDKVDQAYHLLEKEKQDKAAKKARFWANFRKYYVWLIVGAAVTFFIWYGNLPRIRPSFKGKADAVLASTLNEAKNAPKEEVREVKLLADKQIHFFVTMTDIFEDYLLRWELYDPDKKIADQNVIQLQNVNKLQKAYFTYDFTLSNKPGVWHFKVFADDKVIIDKSFHVALGDYNTQFAKEIDANKKPLFIQKEFKKTGQESIYCYTNFDVLAKKGIVQWIWIDPDGSEYKKETLETKPEMAQPWWVYDSLKTNDLKTGTWKVRIFFDKILLGEYSFELKP